MDRVHSRLLSNIFSIRLSCWEGLGATFSHSYESIPLPEHSRGTHHTSYWLHSGGNQLLLPASQLRCCCANQLPCTLACPLCAGRARRPSPQQVGLCLSSLPGLVPAGMNWAPKTGPCCKPLSLLHHRFPVAEPHRLHCDPLGQD